VFFGTGAADLIMLPLIIFHQIQLLVCAAIATRMSRTEVGRA
jgi:predicted Na+-dependent transporter